MSLGVWRTQTGDFEVVGETRVKFSVLVGDGSMTLSEFTFSPICETNQVRLC